MSSTRKFTFAQGEPELPSGYIVPEPMEETPTDTAAAPAGPEAGPTAQPTPAEGTTPAAGDANQTQTTQ